MWITHQNASSQWAKSKTATISKIKRDLIWTKFLTGPRGSVNFKNFLNEFKKCFTFSLTLIRPIVRFQRTFWKSLEELVARFTYLFFEVTYSQLGLERKVSMLNDINILFTLIKCFHLHREKVRRWTSRYPQDEEISSGLTNCSSETRTVRETRWYFFVLRVSRSPSSHFLAMQVKAFNQCE